MDTDTRLCAPSAGASSARADGAPAITATEHDQHMESTTELAASSGSGSAACTTQTVERQAANWYDLLKFFSAAIKDVSRASAPHWFSLDEECDILIRDFFDVWNNTRAMHYFALFSQPLLLKHKEIFDVLRYDKKGRPGTAAFSNGADEFTH